MSEPAVVAPATTRWGKALATYGRPRIAAMFALGFSAGLPFLLVFTTLTAWLTQAGVSRSAIGFFSWIGITYSIKVFWSPVVDRLRLPLLGRLLGQRRSWMLVAQLVVIGGLCGMAFSMQLAEVAGVFRVIEWTLGALDRIYGGIQGFLLWIGLLSEVKGSLLGEVPPFVLVLAFFGLIVAFGSATQDVAIDAWRIEAAPVAEQAAMASTYVFGYRIALMVAGAGALFIAARMAWTDVYLIMGGLMGVGVLATLLCREPQVRRTSEALFLEQAVQDYLARSANVPRPIRMSVAWLIGAIVCPFVDFFRRYGLHAAVVLLLVATFRISDISMGAMANPFYIDLGFSLDQIAGVAGLYGVVMTVAGGFAGGLLAVRYGLLPMLLVGAILSAATNLLFAAMALVGPETWMLVITISGDNFFSGFAMAVFIAWLSSLVSMAYTATQYALFSSLMSLPGKFIGGFSGVVVDAVGYFQYFVYVAAIGIPAIMLCVYLMLRERRTASEVV